MRLLVISDTHCGATSGLTPPGYQHEELAAMQKPFWNWFSTTVEVIDLIEGMPFCRGAAIKYIARAGIKDPEKEIEDLRKARWMIDREIARIEKKP